MGNTALLVTTIEGVEECAAELARQLHLMIDVAAGRKAALTLLGRREYAVVIVDRAVTESDPDGAELLWKHAGLAVPLEVNFAISGAARLVREVRAALARREQEQLLATQAAVAAVDSELKDAVTGFLLQSQLALAEKDIPPGLEAKLKQMAELAGALRQRLEAPDGTGRA
ncbi:hypothetical protein [Paracidobacterium acidisoli]|uniref:ANTAR domain-containing protein n=1 Tax=Paracidobacterium acidisoli TaxID=2303751 RepID=A0A372IRG2_9BACT|nr:hypothetical protein [Paracidobacterium acidisoli]MBT9330392.1 hypothetical protein [Paracidobacterium acidisoli]